MWPFSLLWERQQFPQNRYRPLTLPGRWLTEGVWSWEESREPEERAFTGSDSQRPMALTKTPYFEVEVDLEMKTTRFGSHQENLNLIYNYLVLPDKFHLAVSPLKSPYKNASNVHSSKQ